MSIFRPHKNIVPHAGENLHFRDCGTFSTNGQLFADPKSFTMAGSENTTEHMAVADLPFQMRLTQWAGGTVNIIRMGSPATLTCSGRAMVKY